MPLILILIIILLATIDGSIATLIMMTLMYLVGLVIILLYQGKHKRISLKLYNIVFLLYLILSFWVSISFSANDYFYVFDSTHYIDSYLNSTSLLYGEDDFINCYIALSDSNVLYNTYLNAMAMFMNNYLGRTTVYSLTLCQTFWGILSSLVLFRILVRRFDEDKAFYYSLIFACCSLFLFYSTVIIRDIIICFLYLIAFDIVDKKFKLIGVIKLILIIVLVWGIRLYSGLFSVAFLAYYLYVKLYNSRLRHVASFAFMIVLIAVMGTMFTSTIVEQTVTELNYYSELSAERSAGGMVSKLQSLPIGVSHLAIVLFTMIRPMPPFSIYLGAETISHFVISTMILIAGFFWFVVFYSLCYKLFVRRYISKIPFERLVLLLVCLVFMLANASHPDIRRMLPVFPILYTQFVEICNHEKVSLMGSGISKSLITCYIIMAFGMLVIM